MQLQVEKIAYASETLLQTISALRVSGVANNVPHLNAHMEKRIKDLKDTEIESQQALVSLSLEIADLLQELEHSYYTTPSFD
ncbi:hypothetical protein GUITHDRAFT_154926 [Guillardia theta CCMP2712]|uniref:Uncharacterized protein n=2 Tax=Guillardia theta TaxID=55529 RepID=L1IMV3_GUITC|nr:hypothetical protein GUITHDRAFT_154926 [Guillardia theta CCMP2712]EKX37606.1 hypothetical protein GUITHDRAFT_154926 [Guillardia theta CCMP2712]|eukprot:XP_005824586.1 hypothetical protein GUITHDRAFT_154926 [Guillardia theta CCMP2712]